MERALKLLLLLVVDVVVLVAAIVIMGDMEWEKSIGLWFFTLGVIIATTLAAPLLFARLYTTWRAARDARRAEPIPGARVVRRRES